MVDNVAPPIDEDSRQEKESYYNINVSSVYKNIISQIDGIRSHVDSTSFRKIDSTAGSIVDGNTPKEDFPQESRFSAFMRLIGLPIFDGKNLYSPGYDVDAGRDKGVIAKRNQIAKNICANSKLINILNQREIAPRNLSRFISKQDSKASILALSTLNIREFSLPFKSVMDMAFDTNFIGIDPLFVFDTNISSQINVAKNYTQIAELAGYDDLVKNNQIPAQYISRPHIIRPLMVDPRADLSVIPAKNRIAAPFVIGKEKVNLRQDVYLSRPYLEKVIRDRFSSSGDLPLLERGKYVIQAAIGKENASKDIFEEIKNSKDTSSYEKIIFANFINIIRATMTELYKCLQAAYPVAASLPSCHSEAKYNWIPMPNKSGLDAGCEAIPLTDHYFSPSNTPADQEILDKQIKKELADLASQKPLDQSAESNVDLGSFAITNSSFLIYDFFSPQSISNDLDERLNKLHSKRNALLKRANSAISSIEIIMGEISGLGLSDILAISAALWYTDKEHLIYLIDKEAAKRMALDKNLNGEILQRRIRDDDSTANMESEAVAVFHRNVARMYYYMDELYKEISTEARGQTTIRR
jgi:hypothetical protein